MTIEAEAPSIEPRSLDELWFQVAGTLCNLACGHCFISCHPGNDSFGFLRLETVLEFLEESRGLGVKEYYFTGGEPFLNPEIVSILEAALRHGPATVLTNATLLREEVVLDLERIAEDSRYSLEVRVSIDGYSKAMNDPLRGKGSFDATIRGLCLLLARGFLPIITAVATWSDEESPQVFERFADMLRGIGYTRPRIKFLPTLRIGKEAARSRGYLPSERVTREMMEGYDAGQLLCSHSRMVTDRGVAVCPILIEEPGAHLGASLAEAWRPFPLSHAACTTCYAHGAICSNSASTSPAADR
jgi:sulfatase maturation enzyme AslB (radical SAM superfamily)